LHLYSTTQRSLLCFSQKKHQADVNRRERRQPQTAMFCWSTYKYAP